MILRELVVHRCPAESSCILSLGYLAEHAVLDVEFLTGDVYRYFDVPPNAYTGLLVACSLGAYFNRVVKNRFDYVRLPEVHEMTQ